LLPKLIQKETNEAVILAALNAYTKHFTRILQQAPKEDQVTCFNFILECFKSDTLRRHALEALETATVESTIMTLIQMDIEKLRTSLFGILLTSSDPKKPAMDWILALRILLKLRVLDSITTPVALVKLGTFFTGKPQIFNETVFAKLKTPAEQHVYAGIVLDLIRLPSLMVEVSELDLARALNFIFFHAHHSVLRPFSVEFEKTEKHDILPRLVTCCKLGLGEALVSSPLNLTSKAFKYLCVLLPMNVQPVELLLELFVPCHAINPELFLQVCFYINVAPNFIPESFVQSLLASNEINSVPLACQLCPNSIPGVVKFVTDGMKLETLNGRMVDIYRTPEIECYDSPLVQSSKGEDWELKLKKALTPAEKALVKERLAEEAVTRKEVSQSIVTVDRSIQLLKMLIMMALAFPIEFTPLVESSSLVINSLLHVLDEERVNGYSLFTGGVINVLKLAGEWSMEDDYDDLLLFATLKAKVVNYETSKKIIDGIQIALL
jgi:hypothetical protein